MVSLQFNSLSREGPAGILSIQVLVTQSSPKNSTGRSDGSALSEGYQINLPSSIISSGTAVPSWDVDEVSFCHHEHTPLPEALTESIVELFKCYLSSLVNRALVMSKQ